jgi:hypothetical protein
MPGKAEYTVLNKKIMDAKLSMIALGLLAFLLSRPPDWELGTMDLVKLRGISRYKLLDTLLELKNAGYVRMRRFKDEKGHFYLVQYDVSEEPEFIERY